MANNPLKTSKFKFFSIYTVIVTLAMGVAWYLRTLSAHFVFQPDGTVRFVTNDALFHMRVVYTLLQNYPNRLFYDPWTNYPYGSFVHFGPLFEQLIAIPALIIGFGHPSTSLVDHIGAYLPVILGTATVIPAYYIGKYMGGRNAGLIGAILIAIMPGQLISRSLVGLTDNHIAEVFFSTLFMMLFMLSIITSKKDGLIFDDVLNRNFIKMRRTMVLAVLTGVSYAAYQLVWTGAPLFAFIICVYALVQYIINNLRKESTDYLAIVGVPAFLISTLLVLPAIHPSMGLITYYYSWFTVVVTVGAMGVFVFLSLVEKYLTSQKFPVYYYPISIAVIGAIGLLITSVISPNLYETIVSSPSLIFNVNTGGAATIAEASSIFYYGGTFTMNYVYANFTVIGFFASIIGILALCIQVFNKAKPERLLLLVWSILMLLAIYGQNRFAYYYSVDVALLCAYLCGLLFEKTKFDDLFDDIKKSVQAHGGFNSYILAMRFDRILVIVVIIGGFLYPMYAQAQPYTVGGYDPSEAWLESCLWLNNNTPAPSLDFNGLYTAPPTGMPFNYTGISYGVMSWWDFGHYIETIGHRMPNANPFQAGIGNSVYPGAAPFFTAPSEENATDVLMRIDQNSSVPSARYVMSSASMATDIFMAMPAWMNDESGYMQQYWTGSSYQILPAMRYYNSMEARLHIFDGDGLKHYRLVHESFAMPTAEVSYKKIYNLMDEGNIPEVDTGNVKIFEYVKGANITGYAGVNQTVMLNATILTSQNRTFEYTQTAMGDSNGNYTFTVPYSQSGPITGETQFDVAPVTPYTIRYGGYSMHGNINEEAVLTGQTIQVGAPNAAGVNNTAIANNTASGQ